MQWYGLVLHVGELECVSVQCHKTFPGYVILVLTWTGLILHGTGQDWSHHQCPHHHALDDFDSHLRMGVRSLVLATDQNVASIVVLGDVTPIVLSQCEPAPRMYLFKSAHIQNELIEHHQRCSILNF